ncbi:putative chromatin regulator PHD family protein [Tanacetum coccineum]
MELLQHFSHDHLLSLIHLQKNKNNVNSDGDEDESKDDDDFVVEDPHNCPQPKTTTHYIQRFTDNTFSHSHLLTLAYSFPYDEYKSKFFPLCKVCAARFDICMWIYKCDKCRYYVHIDCATSKKEPFMSIFMSPGVGKTFKNFKDEDHPNLLKCPFPDESCDLLKHHFSNHEECFVESSNAQMFNHNSHPHQLIRFNAHSSLREKSVSLHDPMKRSQLLCDGCVKPVTTLPFYKCSQSCDFVLHEWCVRLPSEIQNHPFHPKHTLVLLTKYDWTFFYCNICSLRSNGFMYECAQCDFRIDINCAFIPEKITHEAHPNHLLSITDALVNLADRFCKACDYSLGYFRMGFHCRSCDFYLHTGCALLLPSQIIHKFNKHPLTLRYEPVENHIGEYFCEICEDELDPIHKWFYHCSTCAESMHTACVPIKQECEQAIYRKGMKGVYDFINVKFGGTYEIESHPHRVSLIQGTTYHGCCERCSETLKSKMIFKCLTCIFAIDFMCAVKSK